MKGTDIYVIERVKAKLVSVLCVFVVINLQRNFSGKDNTSNANLKDQEWSWSSELLTCCHVSTTQSWLCGRWGFEKLILIAQFLFTAAISSLLGYLTPHPQLSLLLPTPATSLSVNFRHRWAMAATISTVGAVNRAPVLFFLLSLLLVFSALHSTNYIGNILDTALVNKRLDLWIWSFFSIKSPVLRYLFDIWLI